MFNHLESQLEKFEAILKNRTNHTHNLRKEFEEQLQKEHDEINELKKNIATLTKQIQESKLSNHQKSLLDRQEDQRNRAIKINRLIKELVVTYQELVDEAKELNGSGFATIQGNGQSCLEIPAFRPHEWLENCPIYTDSEGLSIRLITIKEAVERGNWSWN